MWDDKISLDTSVDDFTTSEFKQSFDEALIEYDQQHQGSQKKPWTQARVVEVINEIKIGRDTLISGLRRTPMEYYWMSKYDVMTIENEDHLIFKRSAPEDLAVQIMPREQYFDILSEIHASCKHGGRDKMLNYIKNKYYIPKKAVELYVSLCPKCHIKRNVSNKEAAARHNISHKLNIRGQVDLIDFQACPDGEFNWLLSYQDDATKFLSLRPLKTNSAGEVTCELIKIFLTFGAPTILQLDNRHEFGAKVTEELTKMWSDFKVFHKNTQIKGNNQEIEQMLHAWMTGNNSTKWSVGCFVVQYEKNDSVHRMLGRSPYKTLFGCDPKTDLGASNLSASVLLTYETENQWKVKPKEEPSDDVPGQSSDEDC